MLVDCLCKLFKVDWEDQLLSPDIAPMVTGGSRERSEGGETLIKALITICHAQWLLEAGNMRLSFIHNTLLILFGIATILHLPF